MKLKKSFLLIPIILMLSSLITVNAQDKFAAYPIYDGDDLGVHYNSNETNFKIWAPVATSVKIRLYEKGDGGRCLDSFMMGKDKAGTWHFRLKGDHKNLYYTFQVLQDGKYLQEKPDVYAKAVGVNGQRGMIADMTANNPAGWDKDKRPFLKNFTDIILYETHIRDHSMDPNSGIRNKGKFAGMTETGTKTHSGISTGLDHIKDFGVTHVHLLPAFDFASVDERNSENAYNWGYDPLNYNVPEGSFSSDAYDGNARVREFKQMVKNFHDNGLSVVLDVVYNHTSDRNNSVFNQFAPLYFYRLKADGNYSDATGCGNETASEREMMKKFIIESVLYWMKEYHIDGFRFDLMGVHDIITMNELSEAVHKKDPGVFIYGEGWTAGSSPIPDELRAIKINTHKLKNIAAFSDELRDAIRGPHGNVKEKGFASGAPGKVESLKFGIVAATSHPGVNYAKVNYSNLPWACRTISMYQLCFLP